MKLLDADLPTATKLLAFVIETRLNHSTLKCWPSYKSLMRTCNISKPTLMKALNRLEDEGWIVRSQRKATTTIYSISPVEGVGKNEAPTPIEINEDIRGVGKDEAPGVGKDEAPLTLSSNPLLNTLIDSNRDSKEEDEVVDEEDKWEEFFGEIDDDESEVKETWTVPDIKEDELLDRMMDRKKEAAVAEEEEVNPYIYVYDPGMSNEDNYIMKSIVDENRMKWDEERSRI